MNCMEMVLLDDLDRRLIQLLMDDASCTNVALARKLDVSDVTVRNRTQRLVEAGVIKIVAIVDPQRIGHQIHIICGIEVELHKAHDVARALATMKETSYVAYTSGQYDLILVAGLPSEEELFTFLTERIPGVPGIRRIYTNQVLKAIKHTHHVELEQDSPL
jgi:Lrp/AsnC family transcriptional regulator, regulator for asnA, asnC and gidA